MRTLTKPPHLSVDDMETHVRLSLREVTDTVQTIIKKAPVPNIFSTSAFLNVRVSCLMDRTEKGPR